MERDDDVAKLKQRSLAQVSDPRRAQGGATTCHTCCCISVLAVASGATSYRKIEQFMADALGAAQRDVSAAGGARAGLHGLPRSCKGSMPPRRLETALRRGERAGRADGRRGGRAVIALDRCCAAAWIGPEDRRAAQVPQRAGGVEAVVLGRVLIEGWQQGSRDRGGPAPDQGAGAGDCLYTLDALHLQKHGQAHRRARRRRADPAQGNKPRLLAPARTGRHKSYPLTNTTAATLGRRNRIEQRRVRDGPGRRRQPGTLARSPSAWSRSRAPPALRPAARTFSPRRAACPVPVHPPNRRRRARPGYPRPLDHRKPAPSRQRHGPGRGCHRIVVKRLLQCCAISLSTLRTNGQTNITQALYRNALLP